MVSTETERSPATRIDLRSDWPHLLVAGAILILSAWLRLSVASAFSVTLDEATLIDFARGILERGYPYIMVGSMEVPLATYELVPYPIAASIALFGVGEFAARLPSALFGVGTTALIYFTGARWFDRRSATLAALLYALSPWAIYWGHNCFHPAQAQFFGLLTLIYARPLLDDASPQPRSYVLAVLAFILAYLSWEGIGFLLPVTFIAGLAINWGRWPWLRRPRLWFAILAISVLVVLQGVRRVLLQVSYLMVGSGKSETSLPQFVFTQPDADPWFYIRNFFGLENHLILSAVFLLGLCFLGGNRNLRYVYAVTLGAIFFLTNFLAFNSAHYVFWVLPFFLIGVSVVTIRLADVVMPPQLRNRRATRATGAAVLVLLIGLDLGTATPYGIQFYDVAANWQDPQRTDMRIGLAGVDYRSLSEVLRREYRPGDVVITMAAMPMRIYSGIRGEYFLQGITAQKVVYDHDTALPYYVDKYVGNPVLRGRQELEDLLYRHDRVWLFVAPYGVFTTLQEPDIPDFIRARLKIVAESFDGQLYLWSR